MGARGISSLMVEGGAKLAESFLEAGLVDEIALFIGSTEVGAGGLPSPLTPSNVSSEFRVGRVLYLDADQLHLFSRG